MLPLGRGHEVGLGRGRPAQHGLARRASRAPQVDAHAARKPDRPGDPGPLAGGDGRDPEGGRQEGADHRGQRHLDAAHHDGEGHAERALEVGLAPAQPQHGELGGGQRDQHAEAVEAGEEALAVARGGRQTRSAPRRSPPPPAAPANGVRAPRAGRAKAWGSMS